MSRVLGKKGQNFSNTPLTLQNLFTFAVVCGKLPFNIVIKL